MHGSTHGLAYIQLRPTTIHDDVLRDPLELVLLSTLGVHWRASHPLPGHAVRRARCGLKESRESEAVAHEPTPHYLGHTCWGLREPCKQAYERSL